MAHTEKRIEWKARIDAWKARGLSAVVWCREQVLENLKCINGFAASKVIKTLI